MSLHARKKIYRENILLQTDSSNAIAGNVSNTKNIVNPSLVGTFDGGLTIVNNNFEFDGVNDSVNFGNNFDFDGSTPFSLCCLFKSTMTGTGELISKNSGTVGYQFRLGAGKVGLVLDDNGSNIVYVDSDSNTFNDGNTHLAIATYDGSKNDSGINIYVDGILQASTSVVDPSFAGSISNANNFLLGYSSASIFPFQGSIRNGKVYNSELTQQQVTKIWDALKHIDL